MLLQLLFYVRTITKKAVSFNLKRGGSELILSEEMKGSYLLPGIGKGGLILLLTLLSALAFSQAEPPVLHCVQVNPDGSVTLAWGKAPAITDFEAYKVYYSIAPGGPFSEVGSIADPDQESWTHAGAIADQGIRYYYMTTKAVAGESEQSETLSTIFLKMITSDFENIFLQWNKIHEPPLPSTDIRFKVYREYPPGNWALLDSTTGTSLYHLFSSCNPDQHEVNFRVEIKDVVKGCYSVSNLVGDVISNSSKPTTPAFDSVSIDESGNVILGWQPGPETDILGYIIYRVTSINDSIDFVPGQLSSSYMHAGAQPCNTSYRYAIAAVDSCGNESPGTFNTPQNTILLNVSYDPCLEENRLTWNQYLNFDPVLDGYRVFVSINDGPYQQLTTVIPGQLTYAHTGLDPFTKYTYLVRAFNLNNEKTSSSCRVSVTTYDSPKPEYLYTRFVTVNDDEQVDLLFHADTSAFAESYRIFRATGPQGPFEQIGILPSGSDPEMEFTDGMADVGSSSYYYKITVTDSCGVESDIANISRTIFLQVDSRSDMTNHLGWNAYDAWDGGVDRYNIYRRTGSQSSFALLTSTGAGELEYIDDVSSLSGENLSLSYRIEAVEGPGNSYGFQETSWSNIAGAFQEARIYMPNAFAPRGLNNRLRPVTVFVQDQDYQFLVYNRWGQMIFQTNDPAAGWDGTYNGSYVQQDVYVYLVRFRSSESDVIEKHGTVAVIF